MTRATRRRLMQLALVAGALPAFRGLGGAAFAEGRRYAPATNDWRIFELRSTARLPQGRGAAQVWLPVPQLATGWQRTVENTWSGNATRAAIVTDPASGAQMLHAEFDASVDAPQLELVSRVQTRNRVIDWTHRAAPQEDPAVLEAALRPASMKPLDGVVQETARKITAGAGSDREKVAAIYAWIVANCYRNLDTPGCGPGDIRATLTSDGGGGKCADLNGLFVGLARAAGVPARDIYGVRVAPSDFGYRQLGANSEVVTGAQHCRAEVWLADHGWVAMDPADVLKVMRAETDDWIRDADHPLVAPVNAALLGNWEGNWIAFNSAEDIALPGADTSAPLPFLMYPQGADGHGRFDELDAESFSYAMTAKEV